MCILARQMQRFATSQGHLYGNHRVHQKWRSALACKFHTLVPKEKQTGQANVSGKVENMDKVKVKKQEKILEWYCRDYQKGACNLQAPTMLGLSTLR